MNPSGSPLKKYGGDLLFALLSALYTWPALRLDPTVLPTRHFDLYPSLWLLHEAPFPRLFHENSGWPFGESLTRVDSWIWLFLGWLNPGFSTLSYADFWIWAGPVLSAMAAERCAHHAFGISRPSSWMAGLAFGFSGISAVTLLEGHVYALLDPWLPLLLGMLWVGTGPQGRWFHGLLAGLAWSLCLYTTAYLGVCATLLVVVLLLRAPRLRMLWALLPAAPAAAWYLWLFSLGTAWKDNAPTAAALQTGGSTLQTLLHVPPEVDLGGHSIGAPLAFCSFWLWALAPFVLPAGWRTLWGLALLALLLSFGAWFRVYPGGPGVASPMAWLAVWLPALSLFRFPIRLLWLFHLLSGILASRVLAERWTRGALWVPVALLDLLGSSGMPGRQGWGIASLPSAYRALPDDRPVLEVYGEVLDPSSGEMEMRVRALGCYDQTLHGKPIPEVCIGTALQSPREIMDRWLMRQLSEKDVDPAAVVGVLEKGGVGAVALHLDTLRPSDAKFLFDRLEGALGPPLSESKDAGERLQIFSLSDVHHDVLGFRSVLKSMEE